MRFKFRVRLRLVASVALLAASLAWSVAYASPSIGVANDPSNGSILADDRGMTVYKYTPDQPNTSTCYEGCSSAWPPVLADAVPQVMDPSLAAGIGIAARTDGTQQVTYLGAPLYYFIGDTQPGTTTGQGQDGIWFVVNP
jgi:predicted lipoprotein with Yx(FWY)xxD motif